MITINGWCAGGKGVRRKGGVSVQSMGEMGKDRFLKKLTEGAVTTEANLIMIPRVKDTLQ